MKNLIILFVLLVSSVTLGSAQQNQKNEGFFYSPSEFLNKQVEVEGKGTSLMKSLDPDYKPFVRAWYTDQPSYLPLELPSDDGVGGVTHTFVLVDEQNGNFLIADDDATDQLTFEFLIPGDTLYLSVKRFVNNVQDDDSLYVSARSFAPADQMSPDWDISHNSFTDEVNVNLEPFQGEDIQIVMSQIIVANFYDLSLSDIEAIRDWFSHPSLANGRRQLQIGHDDQLSQIEPFMNCTVEADIDALYTFNPTCPDGSNGSLVISNVSSNDLESYNQIQVNVYDSSNNLVHREMASDYRSITVENLFEGDYYVILIDLYNASRDIHTNLFIDSDITACPCDSTFTVVDTIITVNLDFGDQIGEAYAQWLLDIDSANVSTLLDEIPAIAQVDAVPTLTSGKVNILIDNIAKDHLYLIRVVSVATGQTILETEDLDFDLTGAAPGLYSVIFEFRSDNDHKASLVVDEIIKMD